MRKFRSITNKNFERNRALKKRKKGKLSIQGTLLPFGYCTVPGTSESSLKVQTDKKAAQILVVLHRNRPPGSFNVAHFFILKSCRQARKQEELVRPTGTLTFRKVWFLKNKT